MQCCRKALKPIPKPRQKTKEEGKVDIVIKSNLLILDLKQDRWKGSGKEEETNAFHSRHVLEMKDDFWDRVHGVGDKNWKGCDWEGTLIAHLFTFNEKQRRFLNRTWQI